MGPYTREKIENWVGDFCGGDAVRPFSSGTREYAPEVLAGFLTAACAVRAVEPEELEEADIKPALLKLARLNVPESVKQEIPGLCAALLTDLESQGRLGGGRVLGAYARALREAFAESASGKTKPFKNPGSRIGRNDPCPCGSGRKYKKCCGRE